MQAPLLELYYFDSCPYCQRVLKAIDKLKVKVSLLDIHEGNAHLKKLMDVTGRKTVPCMFIDGKPMFESLDIIAWMENNIEKLDKIS